MAGVVVAGAMTLAGTESNAQGKAHPTQSSAGEAHIAAASATLPASNPFAQPSSLPFGAPPFDRIHNPDFEPAMLAGIAAERAEINSIADDPAPPTFANTVLAMEHTGALLNRAQAAFSTLTGANTNPVLEQVQADMAPRLSAHDDETFLNAKLFSRVQAVYAERAGLHLDPESLRLLELTYDHFVHAGARLDAADKAKLMALNAEESTLSNAFSSKLLAATKAGAYTAADPAALAGLSGAQLASATAAAKARGSNGLLVPLQNTTQQPALAELRERATRQALFEHSWNRAERGGEDDTRSTVARLAQVRAEKARLLGYPTYAAWKLENQMAKTPEAAIGFLDALVPAATARAHGERKEIQDLVTSQGNAFTVQPWDWSFYAEQVRKAKYDLDEAEVRPYFELNRVLEDGVFYAANKLYGITFNERHDLPVWNPDVRVFEVSNADGSHLALFYCDYFKRDNKRGGAWMSSLVRQSRLKGFTPVVYNVANLPKPAAGEPALISFSDVITMFHEFGHALHGMFSAVEYPTLSGTSVPRDFVEFPSQFNEHWATYPDVFAHFARDYRTGKPMPEELAAKLKRAESFNQGYALTELLAAAELDLEWHTLPADAPLEAPDQFEQRALTRKHVALEAVPPRYRSTYFSHIWAGGYGAGYYAYLWSEMLDDAAYQWFEDHGGLTRANGDRFRQMVLSRGFSEDLPAMYDRWLGGEPKIGPMLKQRGLSPEAAAK